MNISDYVRDIAKRAKESWYVLSNLTTDKKNDVLHSLAKLLKAEEGAIMYENNKDVQSGKEKGLSNALIDRLVLDEKRIQSMIDGVKTIINLKDPIGSVVEQYTLPNGLDIGKIRVPLGLIGIIYESRPNVTIDAAALCLKSGNSTILRGGSEAFHSNKILVNLIRQALTNNGLPADCVSFFDRTDRECVTEMLKLNEYIDLIVPRGGEGLIKLVCETSSIPVVKHDKGVCTLYVCDDAEKQKAIDIAVNAKVQRPGVCNAIENILFDENCDFIVDVLNALKDKGVEVRGDEKIVNLFKDAKPATDEDWSKEYLDLIISAKIVSGMNEAVDFITKNGSGHSDSILTTSYEKSRIFLKKIDSACVYVNASTRFTDGSCFGLGAEIGISTNKLHARGPMGLNDLTSVKWIIRGDGQIR